MATTTTTTGRKRSLSRKRGAGKATAKLPTRNTRVSRWGNSLGVRIPQEAAERLKLRAGEQVTVEIGADSITIRLARRKWSEAELLKGVTPDIVGGEADWGSAAGKEAW
jgi:antitoxin MazE